MCHTFSFAPSNEQNLQKQQILLTITSHFMQCTAVYWNRPVFTEFQQHMIIYTKRDWGNEIHRWVWSRTQHKLPGLLHCQLTNEVVWQLTTDYYVCAKYNMHRLHYYILAVLVLYNLKHATTHWNSKKNTKSDITSAVCWPE